MVIGDRSYGNNPVTVGKMVSAQLDGLYKSGIIGTLKHFRVTVIQRMTHIRICQR
ncbi:MAG: hypothetical protein ACLS48_07280 [[Eubacterium] siraeum]